VSPVAAGKAIRSCEHRLSGAIAPIISVGGLAIKAPRNFASVLKRAVRGPQARKMRLQTLRKASGLLYLGPRVAGEL
jgi:hypothetical protein